MRRLLLAAAVAAAPAVSAAQGGLGVQGYGFPTGQIGSAALAVGGASAEIDPASLLNPATVGLVARYAVYLQYEPEFRNTTAGGASDRTTTIRFPAFLVAGSYRRFTGAISASNLLDRTWRNVYSDSQVVGGTLLPSTLTASSAGSITDARVALSYVATDKLQVGVGVHALVGQNRLEYGRSFPDSTGVAGVNQASRLAYSGGMLSLGAVYQVSRAVVLGASLRRGGDLDVEQDGRVLAEGSAPGRYGLTVAYTGIPNTTFAARWDRTAWSAMRDLGTAQMSVFDTDDLGFGVEVVGPRIGGTPSYARLGLRSRTLPFGVNGDQVRESGFGGGLAVPLARGRGQVDVTLQRATRRVDGASERGLHLSIGLGIRP